MRIMQCSGLHYVDLLQAFSVVPLAFEAARMHSDYGKADINQQQGMKAYADSLQTLRYRSPGSQ